jgi:hypothetical protein
VGGLSRELGRVVDPNEKEDTSTAEERIAAWQLLTRNQKSNTLIAGQRPKKYFKILVASLPVIWHDTQDCKLNHLAYIFKFWNQKGADGLEEYLTIINKKLESAAFAESLKN